MKQIRQRHITIQSILFYFNYKYINSKIYIYHVQIGLYRRVVTYFLRYLWVALNTITPSLIERAYRWLSITWIGSGRRVGSHCKCKTLNKYPKNTLN